MNAVSNERVKELREWVGEMFGHIPLRMPSDYVKRDEVIAILNEYADKLRAGGSSVESSHIGGSAKHTEGGSCASPSPGSISREDEAALIAAQIEKWATAADILSGMARKLQPLAYGEPGGFSDGDIDLMRKAKAIILAQQPSPAANCGKTEFVTITEKDADDVVEYIVLSVSPGQGLRNWLIKKGVAVEDSK
jgi:hypothetical protein